MATDKKSMVRNAFRRASSSEQSQLMVDIHEMPIILNRMGQKVDKLRLMHFIDKHIDTEHTGHLDYDKFQKVCDKFVTDPAILDKVKGDDFMFKHLLTREDFYNP